MKSREELIMDIIAENGFLTVRYLCETLHYSTATINRDLNKLQQQKRIVRSNGGAELTQRQYVPFVFRTEKNKAIKKRLSEEASHLVQDGQTIYINSSTTLQYLAPYLVPLKNLQVVTNNLNLASYLSNENLTVFCLGGEIVEKPYVTGGSHAALDAANYLYDTMFFCTSAATSNGIIQGPKDTSLYKTVLKNARKVVFVIDSSKIDLHRTHVVCDFSQVDVVISDYVFRDEVKAQYPRTEFVEVSL